ncbi:hypothetical protein HNQ93_001306 [Hymenobacter luteus]|uniref:DUF4153 domain-containing protein n=2 Tax=Hymenobacter TaxID=89966 RepID=A0A7W9WBI6_9BACT|nr:MULTISPECIES: DUF4153 domain-containing protein [Hymenobacter]MBB4601333.1 hypothetical protein [Hymenobacter latericoloratus]MBB6058460.1 hypothetical protein [Hymenobacter luteus]
MKLPSLQHLVSEAATVLRRFPLTLLCAFVLGGVGIYLIYLSDSGKAQPEWTLPVLSAAGLGLSFSLAVALAAERYRWPAWGRLAAAVGVVALLGLWYAACPPELNLIWGLRLFVLLVALHLLVAVVPYLPELRRNADTPGFWRYNETLFLRILISGLYSGVLFAGCALALVAIDNLFDVELDERLFGYLFTVLATVFNTWFFLAGVPQNFAALEQEATYPKGLKVFTQFVLLPLVVLYLGILYAYLGRILVQWELPKGWVSILVLALAVAGILALLLIHPIRNAAENTWIRTFARWFYLALFPLLGLLAVAIGTRIRAYGITEERYFVLVLAAWLLVMATYFLVRKGQGIIWIPASLAVVALLSVAGPWGAFATAERSQLSQLREISAQYKLLKDGKLDGAGQRVPDLPFVVRQRLTSIFNFFAKREAVDKLQPLFAASLQLPDSLLQDNPWRKTSWQTDRLFALSNLERVSRYASAADEEEVSASFGVKNPDVLPLGNGRYLLTNLNVYQFREPNEDALAEVSVPEGSFRLRTLRRGHQLQLEQQRPGGSWQPQLSLAPGALADSLVRIHGRNPSVGVDLPNSALTLHAANQNLRLQLLLRGLNRHQRQDSVWYSFEGQAIVEVKR